MALCQLKVGADKDANLATARSAIDEAATAGGWERWPGVAAACLQPACQPDTRCWCMICSGLALQPTSKTQYPPLPPAPPPQKTGADLVVLPEMWNCPYSNDSFPAYAEDVEGGASPSADMLAAAAAQHRVVLVRRVGCLEPLFVCVC